MRKDKKVSSVIGCELNLQLNEPGAGAACESIAALTESDKLSSLESVDLAPSCEKIIVACFLRAGCAQFPSLVMIRKWCPRGTLLESRPKVRIRRFFA